MSKKQKILDDLNRVAQILPSPIYWEDTDSVILGANELVLQGTGAKIAANYVGKTLYEIYPKQMADHIKIHNEEVMRTRKILAQEESIKDISTGEVKHYIAVKSPLFDDDGTVIGLVGTSIDITDRKEKERLEIEIHKAAAERLRLEKEAAEAERLKLENTKLESQNKLNQIFLEKLAAEAVAEQLRLENETYLAQKKEQAKFLSFIDKIQRDIQNYKVEALTEQIGIKPKISNSDKQIRLTKRELDVLYYLSLNKSPKDISQIITIIENKPVSDSTINAIINKKLYPKFEVFNIGQLVEKAIMLNQIPFLLDNSID